MRNSKGALPRGRSGHRLRPDCEIREAASSSASSPASRPGPREPIPALSSATWKAAALDHARAALEAGADDATTLATPGFVIGQVDGDFPTAMNAIDQGLAVTLTRQCR
jgi:hypothetical protein